MHQTPTNATHVSVGPSAPHRGEILPSTNDNQAAGNQLEAEVTHRPQRTTPLSLHVARYLDSLKISRNPCQILGARYIHSGISLTWFCAHQTALPCTDPTNATPMSVEPPAPHREEIPAAPNDNEAAGNQLEAEVTHRLQRTLINTQTCRHIAAVFSDLRGLKTNA